MYERGALDAEQDDLNSFYYQHYYYYRRGYDDARRQQRRGTGDGRPRALLIALAAVAVTLVAVLLSLGGFGGAAPAAAPVEPVAAPTQAPATPTRRPTVAPTAMPTATPAPALVLGGRARVVNLNGSPLRAREAPGLTAVVERIPEGSEVVLREGPVEADGYSWWRVEAGAVSGWVAGRSPEGTVFLEPVP